MVTAAIDTNATDIQTQKLLLTLAQTTVIAHGSQHT